MKEFSPSDPARVCFFNSSPAQLLMEIWFGVVSELRHIPWVRVLMLSLNEQDVGKAVAWGADLLIAHASTDAVTQLLKASGIPVINTSGIPDPSPFPTVTVDNILSGALAARHLLEKGYVEFGFVGGTDMRHCRERFEGFSQTVAEAGLPPPSLFSHTLQSFELHEPAFHLEDARRLHNWVQSRNAPMGVLVHDDFAAQAVMDHLRLISPDFLQDVGIVSAHHSRHPTFPSVSGVQQSEERWGKTVARLALQILQEDAEIPMLTRIPPVGVMGRETTAFRNTHDLTVRQALRLIHRDVGLGINVQDVVNALDGIQRRALERRFMQSVGHSLLEEIQRARVDRACLLLTDTEQTLEDVASHSGFSDTRHLHRVFSERLHITPKQYRMRAGGRGTAA